MRPCLPLRTAVPAMLALSLVLGAGATFAKPATKEKKKKASHPSKLPRDDSRPGRPPGPGVLIPGEFRRIDGWDNNRTHPEWGAAGQALLRFVDSAYDDGLSTPAGAGRPNPRAISNAVCIQTGSVPNRRSASDFLWQWGQFLDHDIDATPGTDEDFSIPIPAGDLLGAGVISLQRSVYTIDENGVRQQLNSITACIDASNVYGSDPARAAELRSGDGTGTLKTTPHPEGDLLPYNDAGFPNAQGHGPAEDYFFAGDVRANEQVGLTAMHTLFVREHNYWAEQFARLNRGADDEECYQFARMIVGAEMQAITYREFLPVLLGPEAIPPYRGYRPDVDPGIANIFSTGAYRLGHSMLSSTLLRLDREGREIAAGHLPLAMAFFNPVHIEDHGIDPVLRGLAAQRCQEVDMMLVKDVRDMLFGAPGSGGMDLAALNIQRGRDHGLPSYTEVCADLGFTPANHFHDLNPDPGVWKRLDDAYERVEDVDCWVGGLCEPHLPGAMTGPMIHRILVDQFTRLRDGDRFFYKNHLPRQLVGLVERQTLSRIIRRNTGIGNGLPKNVFLVREHKRPPIKRKTKNKRPGFPGRHRDDRRKSRDD